MTPWLLPLSTGVHSIRTPFRLDTVEVIRADGGLTFLLATLPADRRSNRLHATDRVRVVERGDYRGVIESTENVAGVRRLRIRVL